MKKPYQKPFMQEMVLRYKTALLTMSVVDPEIVDVDPDEEIDAEEALSRSSSIMWDEW